MNLSKEVFEIDQVLNGVISIGDDQYRFDYKRFEHAVKDVVRKKLHDGNVVMTDIHKGLKIISTLVIKKLSCQWIIDIISEQQDWALEWNDGENRGLRLKIVT